ncbi:MAG: hypothetical protein ACTSWP_12215 [Candidatus Freyarchaeota archaeon]
MRGKGRVWRRNLLRIRRTGGGFQLLRLQAELGVEWLDVPSGDALTKTAKE